MFLTVRRAAIVCALLLAIATPARADITAFLGTNITPDNRPTRGFALGITVLVVGFEFEYSNTSDSTDPTTLAPSLKTGTANLLLQTPVAIAGFQPYFTTGGGRLQRNSGGAQRHELQLEHRRRRQNQSGGTAATAGGLPCLQTRQRCAVFASAPPVCRVEYQAVGYLPRS